jgi:hypothetical protein
VNSPNRISLIVLASWLFRSTFAADPDSVLEDQAAALLAVQLSTEVAVELRQEFLQKGRSLGDADALAFRTINNAAHCSAREFRTHEMPQMTSYFDLLVRNEEMSSVLSALARMYDKAELEQMQSEIARIVQECLASSKAPVTG